MTLTDFISFSHFTSEVVALHQNLSHVDLDAFGFSLMWFDVEITTHASVLRNHGDCDIKFPWKGQSRVLIQKNFAKIPAKCLNKMVRSVISLFEGNLKVCRDQVDLSMQVQVETLLLKSRMP